jgi:hypothetical protein
MTCAHPVLSCYNVCMCDIGCICDTTCPKYPLYYDSTTVHTRYLGTPGHPIWAPPGIPGFGGIPDYSLFAVKIGLFWAQNRVFLGCPRYPQIRVSQVSRYPICACCSVHMCHIWCIRCVHMCPKYPLYYDSNTVYTRYPRYTLPGDTPSGALPDTPQIHPVCRQNRPILGGILGVSGRPPKQGFPGVSQDVCKSGRFAPKIPVF